MHSMKKTLKENSPLKIGSKVPELKGIQWIKGKGVSLGTGLTIVEILATWCGPCLQTIPHLTELQKLYKGRLTIAGLTTESMDEVVPFVKELGKKMDYNVGIAPQDLYGAYMEGIDGIPNAFIINEKKQLLWQGHPYFLDALLPLILGKGGSEKAVLDLSRKKQEVLALHS
ncbi:MAG TPA: TlpA disulfide reductase family protein, partial [Leptospiraceae bacterium]|nr:TlpA disulfide reductase family protein [Leptospiraceae bacterium]